MIVMIKMVARPSHNVIAKRLEGGTVLVHTSTNSIFELNETGTRVWELLEQFETVESIVGHLVEEFDVGAAEATQEVEHLLARLQSEGLIV
jgi:hypothetical protein